MIISLLLAYLIGIAIFGAISGGKQKSVKDYFFGSKIVPWWAVCFSIVAAETSTLTFISIPGLRLYYKSKFPSSHLWLPFRKNCCGDSFFTRLLQGRIKNCLLLFGDIDLVEKLVHLLQLFFYLQELLPMVLDYLQLQFRFT